MIYDTICRLCSSCCPIEAKVLDNKLISAWRKSFLDPEKQLTCPKLRAAPEIVYSPERITNPLIRQRHGLQFEKVSWESALNFVAERFQHHKKDAGAESVAWLRGMAADWGAPWDYANRLMNSFGSPNTIGNGSICFVARDMAHTYTYGSMAFPDAKNSKCILVWGKNDGNTALGAAEAIDSARSNGATLIVIDPIQTQMAQKADIWLQLKPGHDLLLAMAMINVIIQNELFDADFISKHTYGFDRLKDVAKCYSPEKVAKEIWLRPEQIEQVAVLYATTKPACIVDGNGLDMHRWVFDATRAVAMLRALTGNLDIEGGDLLPQPIPVRNIQLRERVPADLAPVTDSYPLFNSFSETWGNQVQGCLVDAIVDSHPYPVDMVVVQSANPVITMADSNRAHRAFSSLKTLVAIDLFMTETTRLADVILPASSCFEKTQLNRSSIRNNPVILQNAVIEPIGDSRPDWQIVFELGRRLGFTKEFPWQSAEEAINYQLEPTGLTVNQLRESPGGVRVEALRYRKYLDKGFRTPSGKVEFSCQRLEEVGASTVPLEEYPPNPPISFSGVTGYDFIGMSGSRDHRFTNSQFFQIPSLVEKGDGCLVDIHPDDAYALNISAGDRLRISTPQGNVEMEARLSTVVHPGSVRLAWGWGELDRIHNLNRLTEDEVRGPVTGTPSCRSFMCKIEKA